jgi:hypothetical protein
MATLMTVKRVDVSASHVPASVWALRTCARWVDRLRSHQLGLLGVDVFTSECAFQVPTHQLWCWEKDGSASIPVGPSWCTWPLCSHGGRPVSETDPCAIPNALCVLAWISQVFVLPRAQAAHSLKISTNCLKRLCRKQGIERWPYRKIVSLEVGGPAVDPA